MKHLLTIAALVTAAVLAPAAAQTQPQGPNYWTYQAPPYAYAPQRGWTTRDVAGPFSDPSNQSPNYRRDKALGRCVEDLGYGRYEYCDW